MPKLDSKFYGTIRKAKNDAVVPPDEWCVFLAKDDCFAAVLPVYRDLCIARNCDAEQIASLDGMIARVMKWRADHPEECHAPDAAGERLLDVESMG